MLARFLGVGIGHGVSRQEFDEIIDLICRRLENLGSDDSEGEDPEETAADNVDDASGPSQHASRQLPQEDLDEHPVDEDENFNMDNWESDSDTTDDGLDERNETFEGNDNDAESSSEGDTGTSLGDKSDVGDSGSDD